MKEYFELVDKYGFKAPLASIPPQFDIQAFCRMAKTLGLSETTITLSNEIALILQGIDERIASLSHLSDETDKGVHVIRNHLNKLEEVQLAETEFVTTDRLRKRRGKHFILRLPTNKEVARQLVDRDARTQTNLPSIPSASVSKMPANITKFTERFLELRVIRYLIKAMRTNRKDKSTTKTVQIRFDPHLPPVTITSTASSGRIAYLPDLTYYSSSLIWLRNHLENLVKHQEDIGETFTLPLEPLIAMSKNVSLSEAKSGGYASNAIEAIKRISYTTFDMSDIASFVDIKNIKEVELYYTLFRLESVVTYEDEQGTERKAITLQFPKWIIQSILDSIKHKTISKELMLFDAEVFSTNNEIEILFNLWARDAAINDSLKQNIYTFNQLRELVAPTSTLNEFKRKFTSLMISQSDPEYKAKISPEREGYITETVGTVLLSGKTSDTRFIEYGRATISGLIVNVGYSEEYKMTVISFRRTLDIIQLKAKYRGISKDIKRRL